MPTTAGALRIAKSLADTKLKNSKGSAGKKGECSWTFQLGDCRSIPYPDDHFDLVFCSPPYESQRGYDELGFSLVGEEWVSWAVECFQECLRVSRGLVAWVVEGFTDNFAYSATPFKLMADLARMGVKVRKPCVYHRNGIPGTGGPDWLRNDWEPIICATKNGRLPWSHNTAMGDPPKQNTPRASTNRKRNGHRKNGRVLSSLHS
jgi:DNA methylase